jgi:hypothetical protein
LHRGERPKSTEARQLDTRRRAGHITDHCLLFAPPPASHPLRHPHVRADNGRVHPVPPLTPSR